MPQLQVGIQLASIRLPFKKALHMAGDLGADAVEIDLRNQIKPAELTQTGLRQLRKMLSDRDLRVCAASFRTRRGYNVLEDLDRRIDASKQAMQAASRLGTNILVNQIGRVPDEAEGSEWDLLVQVLTDLGKYGQHIGVTLAAETGTEDGETLAKLVDALPPGSLGITLDPANLIVNGFSAHSAVSALRQHVCYVHAKDGVRDLAQGRGLETPLGRGSVDFPEIIGTLEEAEYRGYFTIEREHCSDPITEIGQAVEYLRNL